MEKVKVYYPKLDILKFVCCIGVVSIHTRSFYAVEAIEPYWSSLVALCVPLFFIASSFLLWRKINTNESESANVLLKFVKRLAILYIAWALIMIPEWMPGYIKHNPDMLWLKLLPIKLLLGAPHGSWFVTSLVYATIICYGCNRYLSHWLTTFLCVILFFLPELLDFYGLPSSIGLLNLYNSPLKALLPLQIGFIISRGYLDKLTFGGG